MINPPFFLYSLLAHLGDGWGEGDKRDNIFDLIPHR